jgi:hypothetical protein
MRVPKVGDIIYVGSRFYLGHGRDDFVGGQATVTKVEEMMSGGRMVPFVSIKESPTRSFNWEFLEPEQERLRQEFGDQRAHPDPDMRPEFNDDSTSATYPQSGSARAEEANLNSKQADAMTNEADNPKRIRLFQHERDSVFSTTDLEIAPNGSLQLSGYDVGELVQQFVGHDDYEYDVIVRPEHKDQLLLALLADRFGGNSSASSQFMQFLKSKGIPYAFDTWP